MTALPDAEPAARDLLTAGLVHALRLTDPDYTASIASGLTESYTAYDTRLTHTGGNR